MVDFLLAAVHVLALAAIATGLVVPTWRGRIAAGVAVVAVAALVAALAGPESRTLEVVHRYAGYDQLDYGLQSQVVDSVQADGLWWGLVVAVFLGLWALVLRATAVAPGQVVPLGHRMHPFFAPLLLAWSGCAAVLLLEKTAAPAGLVDPIPLERALLPAAIAACALLARQLKSFFVVFLWLALFVTAARLPIAAFGTWATYEGFGTSLDAHTIETIANPFGDPPFPMELEPGSREQLTWLVWAPQLLILPALYMLSLAGIAFAVVMFVTHPKTNADGLPQSIGS